MASQRSDRFAVFAVILYLLTIAQVHALPDNFSVTTNVGGVTKTFVLTRYSIRTPDYWVRTWDSTNGYVTVHDELNGPTPYEVRTYRGYVSESPNERITAFVRPDNLLYAEGHHGKGRLWWAGPVDVSGIVGGSAPPAPQSATAVPSVPVAQEEPSLQDNLTQPATEGPDLLSVDPPHESYLPPVGIYQCEAVYDVPSRMFDSWGSDVERAIAEAEYLFNRHDHFNVRDAKVHIPLSELVIRKEQFYFPANGAWSQFTSMLKSEWQSISRDWIGGVGFIHSNFPYNFSYAGGYAVGNNFYGGNPSYAINALYHENAHNWRANHYYYGVDTMSGSHPHHGEINVERVLYTREQEINIDGELALVTGYPTPMHPYAHIDIATTLVNTSIDVDVLANDWDANEDTLSVTYHTATTVQGGTVTQIGNMLHYTPPTDYVGKDLVFYRVSDGGLYTYGLLHIEVINQSLTAHWEFEETSGSTAADIGPSAHTGQLNNGVTFDAYSVPGVSGNALKLPAGATMTCDASDIHTGILPPGESSYPYPFEPAMSNFFDPMDESFSIAFWFKSDDLSSTTTLFKKKNTLGYQIYANSSGVTFDFYDWKGMFSHWYFTGGGPLSAGTWYHVVAVLDRANNKAKLFVDGQEYVCPWDVPADAFIFEGRADAYVGGGNATTFDDLRIYTKALNTTDIAAIMEPAEVPAGIVKPARQINVATDTMLQWKPGKASYQHDVYFGTSYDAVSNATTASPEYQGRQSSAAVTFDPGTLVALTTYYWRIDEVDGVTIIPGEIWEFSTTFPDIPSGLILHTTMDDEDIQTDYYGEYAVDDLSVSNQDLSIGGEVTTGVTGQIGQALSFDGTDDYLLSYSAIPDGLDVISMSFWLNTTSTATNKYIASVQGAYSVAYYNGDLFSFFDGTSAGSTTFNTNLNDGQWHHVVFTNDGSTTTLYVDGSFFGTQSESLHPLGLGRPMRLGCHWDGGNYWPGALDDFAVWSRVLNSDEVQSIYTHGLAGQTFNATLIAETSFEPSEGFTGFPSGGAGDLGIVVDNDGVEWESTDGADIWNRTDIPPDGIQTLRMGETDPESCSINIPGADHGVSYVSFDYASYSSSTDANLSLSYRVDSGAWIEVWSTYVSGMNPNWDTHPWKSVITSICVAGDVELLLKVEGTKGVLVDNVKVYARPEDAGAPSFSSDVVVLMDAIEGEFYSQTLDGLATDPDGDPLTYSKVSGPGWLDIALDGTVSGTPDDADVGQNGFIVSVTDTSELQDTAILYLQVLNTFGGHWGLDDLSVFAQNWLEADCVDVPACGGADLSSDQDVTLTDYSMLSTNWNTGFVPGLVADWWMDDSAGFVLRDNYRELDGVLYAADETSGWGDALLLDGTDDYAEITGYYGILGNSARTVSFWIQTSQTSDGTIVSWGESGWPWGGQWSVLVSGGKLKVNVGFGYATGTTQINDNQWHHIAVVLPSSASPVSEDIELYVDGFLETLSAYNNVDIDTRSGTIPIELTIGRDASVQTAYFNGKIDNLRIYEIALQLSEIESLAGL